MTKNYQWHFVTRYRQLFANLYCRIKFQKIQPFKLSKNKKIENTNKKFEFLDSKEQFFVYCKKNAIKFDKNFQAPPPNITITTQILCQFHLDVI